MSMPTIIETRTRRKFTVGPRVFTGDLADLHSSTYANGTGDKAVVLKIARDAKDNDLLENEISVLNYLYPPTAKEEKFLRYLPKILDTARLPDKRHVTVFPLYDGYVSMADIIASYPNGIDFRDMAWMYKRLLSAVGFAHEMGVVHGAILPSHVLVHPTGHGAKIVDWSYALNFAALIAAKTADAVVDSTPVPIKATKATASAPKKAPSLNVWDMLRQNLYTDDDALAVSPILPAGPPPDPNKMYVKAISVDYSDYYPPEILLKGRPGPETDVYMAAKCAVALLGGDPATNQIPDSVPAQIRAFLQVSLLTAPHKRPQNAWQVGEDFEKLLPTVALTPGGPLLGKPTYRPFSLPAKGEPS
jgi:serine/threonine protein kinase